MEISTVSVESLEGLSDIQKINERIKSLILTPEGTVPGSRGFGLARNFMSLNPEAAVNELAIELAEKVSIFVPEVMVTGVEGEPDQKGALAVTINIGRRD